MKTWKRNAVAATVLVLVCAGIYLNWAAEQEAAVDFTETLNANQVLDEGALVLGGVEELSVPVSADSRSAADYFAQIRLSRQESRDSAVELLQETIAYDDGNETVSAAVSSLDNLVSDALAESQIESLIIAKGYTDCVAYMGDDSISIAVSAPAEGLAPEDVALISDVVLTQTDYTLDEVRIIEVK